MTVLLFTAAALTFAVGLTHSVLGERYILTHLFAQYKIPPLFSGPEFTVRTLRFAWHLTTLAWWGFAALLVLLARQSFSFQSLAWVVAVTFLASAVLTVVISRGRHHAWLVFLAIGAIGLYAAI